MLPLQEKYRVFPAIYPANQESEVYILAQERAFIPMDGAEYTVTVTPINTDEVSYKNPTCQTVYQVKAQDGFLRFTHFFPREQEHQIALTQDTKNLGTFFVFSLEEDLYHLRPMKGDFHGHSFRSDGQSDPAALAGHFREQGYDFFSLTDHNRFYPCAEVKEAYRGIKTGLLLLRGEEVHTPPSAVHIVRVGGEESVCARYVNQGDEYRAEVEEIKESIKGTVPEVFLDRMAMATWASRNIRANGGIAIFAHPYWRPKGLMYNVFDDLAILLLKSGLFDAYELAGGMGQPGINRSVALWNELRAEGYHIPVVGSSDVHGVTQSPHFAHLYSVVFAKERTEESILEAVRNGFSVAVEDSGEEIGREKRCYGSHRMVTYALFLLNHYFPVQERLCAGEGVAMRGYLMGEIKKNAVEEQALRTEEFRQRYFGKMPPLLPSLSLRRSAKRWRNVQLSGPKTKGSAIKSEKPTFQI